MLAVIGVLLIIQGIVMILFSIGPRNRQTNVNPTINFLLGIFLIGIGLRTLSVYSLFIPRIKKMISKLNLQTAEEIAREMLAHESIQDVTEVLSRINE